MDSLDLTALGISISLFVISTLFTIIYLVYLPMELIALVYCSVVLSVLGLFLAITIIFNFITSKQIKE